MTIASHFGPIDEDVSSSKDEKQDEKLEGKVASTVAVMFVEEGESNASEEDSDDTPLVPLPLERGR